MGRLLQEEPHTTSAIFAVNNLLALFAMRVMHRLDIRVPENISLACFDDTDNPVYTTIPLTTVVQDMDTIGRRAARQLIHRIEGYTGPPTYDIVPAQLRIRQSTSVPVNNSIK
jgi:LacI family transcriptional regulator